MIDSLWKLEKEDDYLKKLSNKSLSLIWKINLFVKLVQYARKLMDKLILEINKKLNMFAVLLG
jgi:hypothetical protein